MKKIRYISLTVFMIILLTSCGKLIDEFYLSDEMKAQIPFKGFETITFIDDNSNLYVLTGEDRFNRIYESSECINCRDYSLFEQEWVYFSDDMHELRLILDAGRDKNYFSIGYDVSEIGFGCSLISPLLKETLREGEIFYDSLIVNNKTYYHVFSDTLSHTGMIEIDPYPVRCYYSTEYGVIKIAFSDSTSWQLESVEWE